MTATEYLEILCLVAIAIGVMAAVCLLLGLAISRLLGRGRG